MKLRHQVFEALHADPKDRGAERFVNLFLAALIILNVAAVILETVEELYDRYLSIFVAFEAFSLFVFGVEYLLRLWTCTEDPRFSHPVMGRLRYVVTPMALIDLVSILPSLIPGAGLDLRFARSVRLMRLARSLKIARYSQSLQTLGNVARSRKHELTVTFFLGSILVVCASSAMYFAEHDIQPEAFSSIPASMWWAVTTLTTVGYGDVYPKSIIGKLLGAVIALLGIGLFALPTGILAGGFTEEMHRRRLPRKCTLCGATIE